MTGPDLPDTAPLDAAFVSTRADLERATASLQHLLTLVTHPAARRAVKGSIFDLQVSLEGLRLAREFSR